MITVKLFTDKRVWRRKYDKKMPQPHVYIWDDYGEFLDKKKVQSVNTEEKKSAVAVASSAAGEMHGENEEGLSRLSDRAMTTPMDVDYNCYTEAQLHVMIAVGTTTHRNRDRWSKNSVILQKKKNQTGHIVLHTYQCVISILLQNIAERLNNENFNAYENDDNGLYTAKSPHKNDVEAWCVLANKTQVTETFLRNHFYVLLTPRKRLSMTPLSQTAPALPPVNLCHLNTLIDLSDPNRHTFDVRDDQEIHIRPIEIFLPVDVIFAGEQGMFGLHCKNRERPLAGDGAALTIKTQRIDHRCVLFVKFHAINTQPGAVMPLRQLCEGLALTNWYDYDVCFGRMNDVPEATIRGLCVLPPENDPYSGWYCGVRAPLAQVIKKRLPEWREWTWMDSEVSKVRHFGQIDFFYWNVLFLRKRLNLYENPLNAVRLNTPQFIESRSRHEIQGNLLDLCFDCWNFTNNLGEIASLLSHSDTTWDKKRMSKYDTRWLLSTIGLIINNREGNQLKKNDLLVADDYARHVVERLLLRVNEEFVTASAHKVGTRIRLQAVFRDTEMKEPKLSTSVALRVASECWLCLRYAVRMIDAIKIRESMQQNWRNSDFAGRLIGCTEQLIKSNKMLFFSGLSSFNLTCVLSINQQNHLCIILDNGDRLIASPVDKMLTGLDDKVNSRLYIKASDVKSTKNCPPVEGHLTFFLSALDQTGQKRHPGKPVVEKYIKQRIVIKSSMKKKRLPKLFSANKVEYIAIDIDQPSDLAHFSRDRFVKRIHIEEEHAMPPLLRLTLADPDGRFDETSQLETLLDEIKVASVRKNVFYSLSAAGRDVVGNVIEQKKNNADGYSVPVSKKTIFDAAEQGEKYVRSPINIVSHRNMRVSRVESVKIDGKRRLIAYLEGLYTTLMYIVKLVAIEGEVFPDAVMSIDNKDCYPGTEKLQAAYTYLLENYEKKNCQHVILENTVELLDDISRLSMRLISQKKYNTYEKVRKLLLGVMNTTESH